MSENLKRFADVSLMTSTAHLNCPICGNTLEMLIMDGVVMGHISCDGCKNRYFIVITKYGKLVMTAELIA